VSDPPVSAPIIDNQDRLIVVRVVASNLSSPGLDGLIPVVAKDMSDQSELETRLLVLILTA
jgi:hypothetical protein